MKKRKAEFRTLINEHKRLEEKREYSIEKMDSILRDAKLEKRELTTEEQETFDSLKFEINGIDAELKKINEERTITQQNKNKDLRTLDSVVYPSEKLEKRIYNENSIDFGKLVKGMSGQGWTGAEEERTYYRSMETGGNKVIIPQQLSDKIIDYARNQSALFGNIPIVQMPSNNLTIAVQVKDGEAKFVKENDLIPASDISFEGVTLDGKTLALFIPISEKLLETASNLTNQLTYSCAKAIAQALDKALLYGKGVVEGQTPEIKGISLYDNVNKVEHEKIDYDLVIKGAKAIKKANLIPTNVCYNTDLASELEMLKTSDGQYITAPKAVSQYKISESNNVNTNETIVYDKDSLLMGIQKGLTIEWGTSGDMFQRIQKGLRIHLRADLGVVRPKGITIATVTS